MSPSTTPPLKKDLFRNFQKNIRPPLLYISDISAFFLSWWLVFHITVGRSHFVSFISSSIYSLLFLLGIRVVIYHHFGLYRALLRYASFHFAIMITKAVLISSFLVYPLMALILPRLSMEMYFIDGVLTLFFIGFSRFFPRYYTEFFFQNANGEKRILIYGAGEVGDSVARSLLRQKDEFCTVGFVDDDPIKIGKKVHNVPILGSREDLIKIIKKYAVNELIVAISNYRADHLRALVKECRSYKVVCQLVPALPGTFTGQEIGIKNIDIADLLRRNPQDLDEQQIHSFLNGKRILITGAAGSIGSELVHQVMRFNPSRLVMVDNSEFGIYGLEEKLHETIKDPEIFSSKLRFILQDLCQTDNIDRLVGNEKPDIIFHAAAYKHVPLIETNPFIGVINNIQGTINIANAADRYQVEKFVLISTDKAVRPTNVMGATKRICELYVQNLDLRSKTEYVSVRFGNVLGSSGSVIPKFLKQINEGGPITVTHPDVVRYFMLIEEAVKLAMQAASIGQGGEIFILNMGQPVKIKEMAEDLIFLAGKEPYRDIDIKFTGLRPGEKLYEELLIDETEKKTQYENITIGKMTIIEWKQLISQINRLLQSSQDEDRIKLLLEIKTLVPEFNHRDIPTQEIKEKKVV